MLAYSLIGFRWMMFKQFMFKCWDQEQSLNLRQRSWKEPQVDMWNETHLRLFQVSEQAFLLKEHETLKWSGSQMKEH